MRSVLKVVVLFAVILLSACGNKIDSKQRELAAKPAASSIEEAKALYDEAKNFERWIKEKENPSTEQLASARALVRRREREGLAFLGNTASATLSSALGGAFGGVGGTMPSIDALKDWFLGSSDPRNEKYGCPEADDPLADFRSKGCR